MNEHNKKKITKSCWKIIKWSFICLFSCVRRIKSFSFFWRRRFNQKLNRSCETIELFADTHNEVFVGLHFIEDIKYIFSAVKMNKWKDFTLQLQLVFKKFSLVYSTRRKFVEFLATEPEEREWSKKIVFYKLVEVQLRKINPAGIEKITNFEEINFSFKKNFIFHHKRKENPRTPFHEIKHKIQALITLSVKQNRSDKRKIGSWRKRNKSTNECLRNFLFKFTLGSEFWLVAILLCRLSQ